MRRARGRAWPATLPAAVLAALAVAGHAGAAEQQAQIVNGIASAGHPAVGIVHHSRGAFCTGTLIGCETFLTAAHCVCPGRTSTAAACRAAGGGRPEGWLVHLAQGGVFDVTAVTIHPGYEFGVRGDLAVLRLGRRVDGIAPVPLNTRGRVPSGTAGLIVGFGRSGGNPATNQDYGVKRSGQVVTAPCVLVPDAANVCWPFAPPVGPAGEDSNTCQGDSGGPLLVDLGSGAVLAGVTAGGVPDSCLAVPEGESFDTDVFVHLDFLQAAAGPDLEPRRCGSLAEAGGPGVVTRLAEGFLDAGRPALRLPVEVPPRVARLRVGLNHQVSSRAGTTDFDLYVRAGRPPTREAYDCRDFGARPFGFCEFDAPAAGVWHVLVDRFAGQGLVQVVAALFPAAGPECAGDCEADGVVSVDDIVRLVKIALEALPVSGCAAGDANADGRIDVDELLVAVGRALAGCP